MLNAADIFDIPFDSEAKYTWKCVNVCSKEFTPAIKMEGNKAKKPHILVKTETQVSNFIYDVFHCE